DLRGTLPADLLSPEGKTRWHLEGVPMGARSIVSLVQEDLGLAVVTRPEGAADRAATRSLFSGADRERWLLPDHDAGQMKMGARALLALGETSDGLVDDLEIRVETVGIGWVHLPSGPREVVLQRALVMRRPTGARGLVPETIVHRW